MEIIKRISSANIEQADPDAVQASINSDGCLVIRTYDYEGGTAEGKEDTLIVFTWQETKDIIELFRKIFGIVRSIEGKGIDELPF